MKSVVVVAALALLSGCPDDDSGRNPDTLWLAPDRVETEVKLAAKEPPPW